MVKSASGEFVGLESSQVADVFNGLLADPVQLAVYMLIIVGVGVGVTRAGVQKGVERVTKVMMMALFVVLVALCVRAVTLPGAAEGLRFYLMPDFGKMFAGATLAEQLATFGDAVYAAMGQAFFTVSVGMGGMSIFGSYIGKDHTLTGEAVRVAGLDTLVALMAGLVIFPSCFAFGVEPGSGPGLVFITLPSVFNEMPFGQLWAVLFFVFMTFAALSTVIAVFENIMSFTMDQWGTPRKKACLVNGVLLAVLSMPCVLGFNVLAGFTVPGIGDIQAIEDFLVSNNILPWGGLLLVLFCTRKSGWGWEGSWRRRHGSARSSRDGRAATWLTSSPWACSSSSPWVTPPSSRNGRGWADKALKSHIAPGRTAGEPRSFSLLGDAVLVRFSTFSAICRPALAIGPSA